MIKFPWTKRKRPTPKRTVSETQSEISGLLVAQMLIDFKSEFRDSYHTKTFVEGFTAVGPMQTFLGHCIAEGYISVGKIENKQADKG